MQQFNYFWWDGGFESVHNKPDDKLNPLGIAHIVTPFYRFDLSRLLASPCGITYNNEKADYLYGSLLSEPMIQLASHFRIVYEGITLKLDVLANKDRSLMVYDSGTICHQLRLKGLYLVTEEGVSFPQLEVELVFYLWQDLISYSIQVVNAVTKQIVKSEAILLQVELSTMGGIITAFDKGILLEENTEDGKFLLLPALNAEMRLTDHSITAQVNEGLLCMHILPIVTNASETLEAYQEVTQGKIDVNAKDLFGDTFLQVQYEAVSGGICIHLTDNLNNCEERIQILAKTELSIDIPLRFLMLREGKARIQEDGTILTLEEIGKFNAMGSFLMPRKLDGYPSGNLWQVSVDGHEFGNYPKPYTHRWMHLYHNNSCTKDEPYEELVDLGWAKIGERPAAHFCQLSLLGWDDNPHYGNELDKTAVQLWHQGLINHQEILCICPESHMTDCAITDIRPIDQKNNWGPNNGGGDFLRYRLPNSKVLSRMRAARCHFPNYGPHLGTVDYYMTSEEDAIHGKISVHIVAADDLARVFVEASYEVMEDIAIEELTLIWLGCPGYDKSRYAKYAWGKEGVVIEDGLVEIQKGNGCEQIHTELEGGEWFAAYRGGIIDEQFREPNANKGLIYRGGSLHLQAHPKAAIKAKRLRIDAFDGITTQFWLGVFIDEAVISLKKGDLIQVAYEYVPILKYATDYGVIDCYSKTYKDLLSQFPDSYQPIAYEAKHGYAVLKGNEEEVIAGALFPTIQPRTSEAVFEMIGGSGWTILRVVLNERPDRLALLEECEGTSTNCLTAVNNCSTYQIEFVEGKWVASLLIKGGANSIEADKIWRKYKLSIV